MATEAAVITLARRYRGVKENPPFSNHTPFGLWYGVDLESWCAIFISYILYTCGMRFPGATTAKGWAFCPFIADYFAKRGKLGATPQVGALALFHNGQRFYHVELVTKVGAGGAFTSIGGNTGPASLSDGGMVLEHDHPADSRTRFAYIDYDAVKVVHPAPAAKRTPSTWNHNYTLVSPMVASPDIARAAAALKKQGFDCGTPANVFGPQMFKAVKGFQKKVGVKVDGVLGPVTAAHLGL